MIYEYHCTAEGCGATDTRIRPVAQRDDPVACPTCGAPCRRQLEVPWVFDGLPREHGARWGDGSGLPTKRMKNT